MTRVVEMTHKPKVDNVFIETITPEKARSWLEHNAKNRPVNQTTVKKYVTAILNSQWELNGETVKFAQSGRLLDGQHRLLAVVESGVSIESYVIRDLPEEVFDTIDCGKTRTISDVLSVEGEVNTNNLGTALRLLYLHEQLGSVKEMGTKLARLITTRDLVETLERNPDLPKSVTFICNLRGMGQRMSIPVATFCHYLFNKVHPGLAEAFFIRLQKGTDIDKGHPIYELIKRLESIQKSTHQGRIETIALTIKAWNAFHNKENIKSLYYDRSEDFPEAE